MRSLVPAIVMVIGSQIFGKKFSNTRKVKQPKILVFRTSFSVSSFLFFVRARTAPQKASAQGYRGGGDLRYLSSRSNFEFIFCALAEAEAAPESKQAIISGGGEWRRRESGGGGGGGGGVGAGYSVCA